VHGRTAIVARPGGAPPSTRTWPLIAVLSLLFPLEVLTIENGAPSFARRGAEKAGHVDAWRCAIVGRRKNALWDLRVTKCELFDGKLGVRQTKI
jgi:hypothetical protein